MLGHYRLTTLLAGLAMMTLPLGCGTEITNSGAGAAGGAGGAGTGGAGNGGAGNGGNSGTGGGGGGTGGSATTTTGTGGAGGATTTTTTTGGGCGDCGGFTCCGSACVNLNNDIKNCGACGAICPGPNPYCDKGACGKAPCDPTTNCLGTKLCCGTLCCNVGELCCDVPGPVGDVLQCALPSPEGTCPKGCIGCVCASPDTPIATPTGDRPIAELAPGDLVYSVHGQATIAVPILRVNKVPAHDHHVVRVALDTGAVLEISPKHPTADGRTFADLRPGDRLDGARIVDVRVIPYAHPFTHDILPDSNSGTYFAAGALIGSTLHGPVDVRSRAAE